MRVNTVTIIGSPGATQVTYPDIFNREIFMVKRSGRGFKVRVWDADALQPTAGEREAVQWGANLVFRDPFGGPTMGRPNRRDLEDIVIIYKT